MEIWDILDESGKMTGGKIVRGEHLKEGEYHLAVHIWILNNNNEFLIQRRSNNIKHMPGIWATTGGSAISGEDSITSALREVKEELGIDLDNSKMKMLMRVKRKEHFADVWITKHNVSLDDLDIQVEEVSDVKWITKEELVDMVERGVFHDYGKEYFNYIFNEIGNI